MDSGIGPAAAAFPALYSTYACLSSPVALYTLSSGALFDHRNFLLMNLASPELRFMALQLLAEERDTGEGAHDPAAARVCAKLGALLAKLAGAAGYRSLLSRAVSLAQAEAPSLKTLHVLPDGKLIGFHEATEGTDKEESERSQVALVAQLLGLLGTFIGAPLTQQLVKEAWPAITLDLSSDSSTP